MVQEYFISLYQKTKKAILPFFSGLAVLYFILDVYGLMFPNIKILIRLSILIVLIGAGVTAVLQMFSDFIEFVSTKIVEYMTDIKEIKKIRDDVASIKSEILNMKQDLEILKSDKNGKNAN